MSHHTVPTTAQRNASGPTVPHALRLGSHRRGGFTFLDPGGDDHFLSFAELELEVDQRAAELAACGLERGDRLALVLADNHEFVLSFLGAMALGVVPVPMYPPFSLGRLDSYIDSTARILGIAGVRRVLTDRRARAVLWSLVERVHCLEGLHTVDDLPRAAGAEKPDVSSIALDDVAFIQFTSGSTASPKGVVVTHRCLLANLHAIVRHGLEVTDDDVAVSWLPLYHDMGLVGFMLAPVWAQVPMTYLPTLSFLKHPTLWLETVHRCRATISFAPNFAFALVNRRTSDATLRRLDLSSIKALGCAAEPNHPGVLGAFADRFSKAGFDPGAMLPCYGMAEATLAMTFNPLGRGLRIDTIDADIYHARGRALLADSQNGRRTLDLVSCGRALPDHRVMIVDEHGAELPERSSGEVVFLGPSTAPGYFGEETASESAFSDTGLFTGDLGFLADGELFVTGRRKDLIILHGRNYDPQTIEWAVAEVDGIRKGNVVAFSCPGEATEQLVVVAEAAVTLDRNEIVRSVTRHVQEVLFVTISEVVLLAPGQLPKTTSGKLQRGRTRRQHLDGTLGVGELRNPGRRATVTTLVRHLWASAAARLRHRLRSGRPRLPEKPLRVETRQPSTAARHGESRDADRGPAQ